MTKIEAIEKTIYNLENDIYEYNWINSDSCNCGVLARTILNGKTAVEAGFYKSPLTNPIAHGFSRYSHCLTTNLPLPAVFEALKNTGFYQEELIGLENLNDEKIIQRGNVKSYIIPSCAIYQTNVYRSDKVQVIKYLKAWVAILKEEQEQNKPAEAQEGKTEIREVIRYVSVPETIKEQSKELILQ